MKYANTVDLIEEFGRRKTSDFTSIELFSNSDDELDHNWASLITVKPSELVEICRQKNVDSDINFDEQYYGECSVLIIGGVKR